jgi:hypothetical protein
LSAPLFSKHRTPHKRWTHCTPALINEVVYLRHGFALHLHVGGHGHGTHAIPSPLRTLPFVHFEQHAAGGDGWNVLRFRTTA